MPDLQFAATLSFAIFSEDTDDRKSMNHLGGSLETSRRIRKFPRTERLTSWKGFTARRSWLLERSEGAKRTASIRDSAIKPVTRKGKGKDERKQWHCW